MDWQVTRNETYRFGSAAFANRFDVRKAGLLKQSSTSLYIGFFEGRPLWYDGAGGLLLVGGARSGKLRDILAYNVCAGIYAGGSMLILDMKGELAVISQDQTPDQKYCAYWNPLALHGMPQMRLNPLDYIHKDSPNLFADVKVMAETFIPLTGAPQAEYFELRAREFLEAIALTLVQYEGVLSLPALYRTINLIPLNDDNWLDFAYAMHSSGIPLAVRVEEEIATSREDSTGGFRGILGELFKSFSCLSDPALMASISPPYNFSFADLCDEKRFWQFYLMCPAEYIQVWAPVIKAIFTGAMAYKSRAPFAPRQTWVLDECAQLKRFPLLVRLFTYGAGIGIRPWAIYQSTAQMDETGENARNIIASSAALQSYFALREIDSAKALSDMLGAQTLEYDETIKQRRAHLARQQLFQSVLEGADPFMTGLAMRQQAFEHSHRTKQRRLLQTPDEVMNAKPGTQFIFADDIGKPILASRAPYYDQRFMAGHYHPNPYHPPADKVRVKTSLSHAWRRVVIKDVPTRYADYPQYAHGKWSYIK